MGITRIIRDNIRTLIDTMTGSGKTFQVAYSEPTLKFDGLPAIWVVPASPAPSNAFSTTNENQRVYTFHTWVFVEYDQTKPGIAYNSLMDCIDEVVNKIDHEEDPNHDTRTMANNLPSGYTLLAVLPAVGEIIPDDEVKILAAQIIVQCKLLVDLTLLS